MKQTACLGPELQRLLKFKVDLKLRTESLAYENGHFMVDDYALPFSWTAVDRTSI